MRILIQYKTMLRRSNGPIDRRRGNILVLAAALIIAVLAFAAFSIDIGYIAVTKSQLQNATDGASLAGAAELADAWGKGATIEDSTADTLARQAVVAVAAVNQAGGLDSVYVSTARDIRLGQVSWNAGTGTWVKLWGVSPYNCVEVTAHRDQAGSQNGDSALPMFFAPAIGHKTANVSVVSTSAMLAGVGFKVNPGSGETADILPLTLDKPTWDALLAGVGTDIWSYDPQTGAITPGPDGILEVNLYPSGSTALPPGNRGTVDLGSPNNSTADLSRQIVHGLNEDDLSYFGGQLRFDNGPLVINGDTGISAGIKDDLGSIKGKPRAIPLFTQVSGPGNNAMYTVAKFVGIRILDVKLTGAASNKYVTVQPAPFVDTEVVTDPSMTVTTDSIFGPPTLIQ